MDNENIRLETNLQMKIEWEKDGTHEWELEATLWVCLKTGMGHVYIC